MCDSAVFLYVAENHPQLSTDQKLQRILQVHMQDPDMPVSVARDARGKPSLPQFPQIHISVTHSGKWFVCAVSPAPVGIDLQEHTLLHRETMEQARQRYCRIAQRFFHPDEAAYVALDPGARFFRIWTAKESYVKYTGHGVDAMFDRFCVLPSGDHPLPPLTAALSWQAEQVYFRQVFFDDGYTFCMCAAQDLPWRWIPLSADMEPLQE